MLLVKGRTSVSGSLFDWLAMRAELILFVRRFSVLVVLVRKFSMPLVISVIDLLLPLKKFMGCFVVSPDFVI